MILHSRDPDRPDWRSLDEAQLVSAARSGDEIAVRKLIRRLNRHHFRVARGIVESDAEAEEVVQESYLAAFTRLDESAARRGFQPGSPGSPSTRRACVASPHARRRSSTP